MKAWMGLTKKPLLAPELERKAEFGAERNHFAVLDFQILGSNLSDSQIFERRSCPLNGNFSRIIPRFFTCPYDFNYFITLPDMVAPISKIWLQLQDVPPPFLM